MDRDLSQPKSYTRGTHRACSPDETLARVRPLAAGLGITRLANVTGLDVIGLPVWVAIRPNARGLSTSQGKGADAASAKASALMESIESWHGEHIDKPLRHDSWAGLGGAAASVDRLASYAEAVVRRDTPLFWIEGWDLLRGRRAFVPFDCVSTSYVASGRGGLPATFVLSSNGLASGNHLLEATLHGLCEIVERDAVALATPLLRSDDPSRRVDATTIDDPACRAVLELLARAGVLAAIDDITSDCGVPTYACTIVDGEGRVGWRALPAFSGYGCHPDPAIAVLRALTEAVQSRLTHISGTRDDISPREYRRAGNPDDLARHRERIARARPALDLRARASLAGARFEDDLAVVLAGLRRAGVEEAVVVDLTRPELGVPVVKVVVPGMEAPVSLLERAVRRVRRSA
jgi:ribosomal protein S12 methylthiotransferase accessory factor